jgi:hypothetical protein
MMVIIKPENHFYCRGVLTVDSVWNGSGKSPAFVLSHTRHNYERSVILIKSYWHRNSVRIWEG